MGRHRPGLRARTQQGGGLQREMRWRSELNNLMITSVLCGSAWRGPVNSLGRRCRGGF